MKAPSQVCEWVKSSWHAVSTEMVRGSFMSCAITSTTGSDDTKISLASLVKQAEVC